MTVEMLMLAAVLGSGDSAQPGAYLTRRGSEPLVKSFAPMPETPGINGRVWHGMLVTNAPGPRPTPRLHAAAGYGAADEPDTLALVSVDGLFDFESGISGVISPWQSVVADNHTAVHHYSPYSNAYRRAGNRVAERLERARNDWLAHNGYTGGVRTFVNDVPFTPHDRQTRDIQPRGVIELPPEVTEFKSRMHVNAMPPGSARVSLASRPGVVKFAGETRIADLQKADEVKQADAAKDSEHAPEPEPVARAAAQEEAKPGA